MPKGTFQCSECKRKFSMAAHLARHRNSAHSPKRGKRQRARPAPRRKPRGAPAKKKKPALQASRRRRPARSVGSNAPLMSRMRALQRGLAAEHAAVESQIAAITRAIDAMSGTAGAARTGRDTPVGSQGQLRTGSLKEAVSRVLVQSGTPLGPMEIAARVVQGGYQTTGRNLANMIGSCLRSIGQVKKSGRGRYSV